MLTSDQAMKQGHGDIARIYAQNAVRKQQEKLKLLTIASRIDATASKVQTAVTTQQVTGNMEKVNKAMNVVLKRLNPERVSCHRHIPQRLLWRKSRSWLTQIIDDWDHGKLRDHV
jgi:division protein CdvB (Snf7/Vps24/ESCRT-III family)